MKTIIYLRVSTEEQTEELQLKDCESISSVVSPIILRDKQSAWKDNAKREDFEKLNKWIKEGKVKHLIVWDFDRLYRNRVKFKAYLEFLKAYGVELHSFRQRWLEQLYKVPAPWNDIVYDLMINIYGSIAEEESSHKSKRVRRAVRKRDDGTFSYKGNKWGRKTISTFKRRRIVELRKLGWSVRKVAEEVNVSIGVVHKYSPVLIEKKTTENTIEKKQSINEQ